MNRNPLIRHHKASEGAPKWTTTFADLMSLLLCFFVLLLSFSELDRQKFKVLSGSLKEAFGVQRIKNVMDMPKGIDIISQDFQDPNFIEETLVEQIRSTIRMARLEGNVRVKEDELTVTVTFPDRLLFDSGSAELKKEALPVLARFREIVRSAPHQIMVVGHTDNIPIHNERFPSNWELSAARASAVIRYFIREGVAAPSRFLAVGKADTVPVAPNDTPENRARNRRVELVFQKRVVPSPLPSKRSRRILDMDQLLGTERPPGARPPRRWPW